MSKATTEIVYLDSKGVEHTVTNLDIKHGSIVIKSGGIENTTQLDVVNVLSLRSING